MLKHLTLGIYLMVSEVYPFHDYATSVHMCIFCKKPKDQQTECPMIPKLASLAIHAPAVAFLPQQDAGSVSAFFRVS